jgi:hypothetical protein
MAAGKQYRPYDEPDLEGARASCERAFDLLAGLALLFGVAAALVLVAGLGLGEPQFAVAAGFALAATLAFALAARRLGAMRRALAGRRPRPLPATAARPRPPQRKAA